MDTALEVFPAPIGINMRCPSDGERVHTVFIFEHMGGVKTIFAAGTGDEAIIFSVMAAVFVAQGF